MKGRKGGRNKRNERKEIRTEIWTQLRERRKVAGQNNHNGRKKK